METKITEAGAIQEQIHAANTLAWGLRFQNIRQAIALTRDICSRINREKTFDPAVLAALAQSQYNLGRFLAQVGEYSAAADALLEALSLFDKSSHLREVILTHAALGGVHLCLSNYAQALQHTLEGFELFGTGSDRELEATLLNNLGAIYIQREDYGRALPYLLKSQQLAQDAGCPGVHAAALELISGVYTRLNNPQAGLGSARKSLEIYRDLGDRGGEAAALNSLGLACQELHDYPGALENYRQAERIAGEIELPYEVVRAKVLAASLHNQREEYDLAVETLQSALKIANGIGLTGHAGEIHRALSSTYRLMENFQKALFHYECFHASKEQIVNAEAESRISSLEVLFQVEAVRREAELEQQKNVALEQEIKERIQIEQALQAANEQLQAEISEREALIADLDAFARMVAHDLKTPLQNLSLLSYLLRRELAAYPNPEAALSLVEQIQQTGMKAGSIINELLTLASLRSADIEFTPIEMNAVIQEALNRLQLTIDERKAEIHQINEFPLARGYTPWLVEVMVNLISNAIHYGGEPPKVDIGAERTPEGFIRYWIKDNGNGISPQDQARLFQDFTRLGAQRVGGHGLGLSITRRIITKLGGTVGVESTGRPGEGAVFWFTLPAFDPPSVGSNGL
jgi:signal transduction histidine kinase